MDLLEDISIISNTNLDLSSISLFGLKLGDSSERIPKEIISEGPYGGWFHTNCGITIRASEDDESKIVEFFLKEEVLKKLNINQKEDILQVFGTPQGIEKDSGTIYHFYPNLKIVVGWNDANNKILGIYLGDNIIQQTRYSAVDFLRKFQEFKAMVPNPADWSSEMLKSNEPRLYRLKELESLMEAFDIGNDLQKDFQNLSFLNKRTIEDLKPILIDIASYALNDEFEKKINSYESERHHTVSSYRKLISRFMRFSEEVRALLHFNSGWFEAGSVMSRYSIYKTQKLLNNIDLTELEQIESLLGKLIDPKNRVYTKYELIKNFHFPDVDLRSIDMDNY